MSDFSPADVIALPVAGRGLRLLPSHPGALLPFRPGQSAPARVPYVEVRTTDPRQQVVRVADNAFQLIGETADGPSIQTMVELVVEGMRVRVLLGRKESARQSALRIAAAIPHGFRAEISDSLPTHSVLLTVERDDEVRREPAAA